MEYRTVRERGSGEFTEKRSRFIGTCRPVETEAQAQEFIASLRTRYWDASHNCSAYILRSGVERFSDDGEPQGTAGIPMLEVLRKEGLTDLVVVATRYFGGILLGGGGLVRAYSRTAALAVEAAGKVLLRECLLLCTECPYPLYGKLQSAVAELGGGVDGTEFSDRVTLRFHLPEALLGAFSARLADLSGGQCKLIQEGRDFFEAT